MSPAADGWQPYLGNTVDVEVYRKVIMPGLLYLRLRYLLNVATLKALCVNFNLILVCLL